jgi:hypothetical protein
MIAPAVHAEIVDPQIIGKDENDVGRARLRDGPVMRSRGDPQEGSRYCGNPGAET